MKLKGTFKVIEVKKKTSATFFKDLKVGDEFTLVYSLNGFYGASPVVDIYQNGKYIHENKGTQLNSNLDKFVIEEVKEG
jgi:hypothetical protein